MLEWVCNSPQLLLSECNKQTPILLNCTTCLLIQASFFLLIFYNFYLNSQVQIDRITSFVSCVNWCNQVQSFLLPSSFPLSNITAKNKLLLNNNKMDAKQVAIAVGSYPIADGLTSCTHHQSVVTSLYNRPFLIDLVRSSWCSTSHSPVNTWPKWVAKNMVIHEWVHIKLSKENPTN